MSTRYPRHLGTSTTAPGICCRRVVGVPATTSPPPQLRTLRPLQASQQTQRGTRAALWPVRVTQTLLTDSRGASAYRAPQRTVRRPRWRPLVNTQTPVTSAAPCPKPSWPSALCAADLRWVETNLSVSVVVYLPKNKWCYLFIYFFIFIISHLFASELRNNSRSVASWTSLLCDSLSHSSSLCEQASSSLHHLLRGTLSGWPLWYRAGGDGAAALRSVSKQQPVSWPICLTS